jgi:hypothetical protein
VSYGYAQKPGASPFFPPVERIDPETPPDQIFSPDKIGAFLCLIESYLSLQELLDTEETMATGFEFL